MRWRLRRPFVPGNNLHVSTAFPRETICCGIPQEILQRPEYERTEPSATRIGTLQHLTLKDHNEKTLREVLSIGNGVALAADESENRSPINFAKLGQRFVRLFLVAARIGTGKHHAPPGRCEAVRPLDPAWGVVWFQGGSKLHGSQLRDKPKNVLPVPSCRASVKGRANKDFTILLRDLAGEVLEDVGASFANAKKIVCFDSAFG